jgi:hypothetical protein
MVSVQMADVMAKRNRAQEHLQALDSAIDAFFEVKPYTTSVEPNQERGCHVVRLMDPTPIPQREWGVLIGDCVHNLRCTLDYIAWQLAGSNMADGSTVFPICGGPRQFRTRRKKRLTQLPESAVALIRCLQPYNTGNPFASSLALIENLDVADKHKLLTVIITSQQAASLDTNFPTTMLRARYEHGAIVAEIHAPLEEKMNVEYEPVFFPAFEPSLVSGKTRFVIPSLNRALRDFDNIIAMFADLSF